MADGGSRTESTCSSILWIGHSDGGISSLGYSDVRRSSLRIQNVRCVIGSENRTGCGHMRRIDLTGPEAGDAGSANEMRLTSRIVDRNRQIVGQRPLESNVVEGELRCATRKVGISIARSAPGRYVLAIADIVSNTVGQRRQAWRGRRGKHEPRAAKVGIAQSSSLEIRAVGQIIGWSRTGPCGYCRRQNQVRSKPGLTCPGGIATTAAYATRTG